MVSGSTLRPDDDRSQSANADLAARFAARNAPRNAGSSAYGLRRASSERSVIQPSPIASVIVPASAGLASSSHRRGVIPLVLLLKRSGNMSLRSLTVLVRRSAEGMAGTPLVAFDP